MFIDAVVVISNSDESALRLNISSFTEHTQTCTVFVQPTFLGDHL